MPSGEQSAAGLLADWPEYDELLDPINRVFLPRADIATENLVAGLVDLGWECDDVTAYRTVRATPPPAPTRDAIKSGKFDAVVFTSSSTVRNLVGIAGKPHPSTVIAVIGPATAKTAEEHGLRVDVLAAQAGRRGARRRARRLRRRPPAGDARGRPAGDQAVRAQALRAAARPRASERRRAGPTTRGAADDRRDRRRRAGPLVRPRRLRTTPALRRMVAETSVEARQLVLPLFVREGLDEPRPIALDAGRRAAHPRTRCCKAVAEAAELGLGGVMLFGIPEHKDATGSGALDPAGILNLAITDVVGEVGDALTVMSDLCLDEFTDHGHCGVLTPDGRVDNDRTLAAYAEMALRPGRRRRRHGRPQRDDGRPGRGDPRRRSTPTSTPTSRSWPTPRSTPRRSTARSARPSTPRCRATGGPTSRTPRTPVEGVREALLDVEQGADIVMVKPALAYLDVVRRVRDAVDVPVAAYNISGEYAMVEAAAAQGWIDREPAILETLTSIRRAGADVVLTYWAAEAARLLARR